MSKQHLQNVRFTEATNMRSFSDLDDLAGHLSGFTQNVEAVVDDVSRIHLDGIPSLLIAPVAGPYLLITNVRW